MSYWSKRIEKQQNTLYDKTLEETNKQLSKYYNQSMVDIKANMIELYAELQSGGEILASDLYKFNRFYDLQKQLNKSLVKLGNEELNVFDSKFQRMYIENEKLLKQEVGGLIQTKFVMSTDNQVRQVLNSVWCADGKHYSNRIWTNKALLQNRIEKGLIDCVSRGVPKDELVKTLMQDFDVGFNQADRIVRTELTYTLNQSSAEAYKNNGIEQYKFLAALDSRTSDICKRLDGKIYSFDEMKVGVNCPPMHVNCRSTIIPIVN